MHPKVHNQHPEHREMLKDDKNHPKVHKKHKGHLKLLRENKKSKKAIIPIFGLGARTGAVGGPNNIVPLATRVSVAEQQLPMMSQQPYYPPVVRTFQPAVTSEVPPNMAALEEVPFEEESITKHKYLEGPLDFSEFNRNL